MKDLHHFDNKQWGMAWLGCSHFTLPSISFENLRGIALEWLKQTINGSKFIHEHQTGL